GVGRHAVHLTCCGQGLDFVQIGGVDEKLHGKTFPLTDSSPMIGGMKSPETAYAAVVPLRPVSKRYTYRVAANTDVFPGQVVRIPFGKKGDAEPTLGVVWENIGAPDLAPEKIKELTPLADFPALAEKLRHFLELSSQ